MTNVIKQTETRKDTIKYKEDIIRQMSLTL